VVAIVGNAAEPWVAVLSPPKDKMDLAVGIAIGYERHQDRLFVAPGAVLASFVASARPDGPARVQRNSSSAANRCSRFVIAIQVTKRRRWSDVVRGVTACFAVYPRAGGLAFFFAPR